MALVPSSKAIADKASFSTKPVGAGAFKVDFAVRGDIPWTSAECRRAGTVHVSGELKEIAAVERDIVRGLAEMTRLGMAMGGLAPTFAGLAGMGDLIATCSSRQSRNNMVGFQLGQGRLIAEVLAERGAHVIVSARSMPGLERLAEKIGGTPVRCDVSVEEDVAAKAAAPIGAAFTLICLVTGSLWGQTGRTWV